MVRCDADKRKKKKETSRRGDKCHAELKVGEIRCVVFRAGSVDANGCDIGLIANYVCVLI